MLHLQLLDNNLAIVIKDTHFLNYKNREFLMKFNITLFSLLTLTLLIPLLAFSQPIITIEPMEIEVELNRGDLEEFAIIISNDGGGLLEVQIDAFGFFMDIDPDEPGGLEIEGGEDLDLIVTIDSRNVIGAENEGFITFESNDQDSPLVIVWVFLMINGGRNPLELIGRQFDPENDVFVGFPFQNVFEFRNTSGQDLEIESVNPIFNQFLSIESEMPFLIEANSSGEIHYSILAPDVETIPVNHFQVTYSQGELFGTIISSTSEINPRGPGFQGLRPYANFENMFTLVNEGNGTIRFSLEVNEEAQGWLSIEPVDYELDPGADMEIFITINEPGLQEGLNLAEVQVETNDPWMPSFTLPYGYELAGELSDSLIVEDWVLNFGAVPVDSTKTEFIIFQNNSNQPITINEMNLDDQAFTYPWLELPYTVDENRIDTLEIEYTPQERSQNFQVITIEAEIGEEAFERYCLVSGWGAEGIVTQSNRRIVTLRPGHETESDLLMKNTWDYPLEWNLEMDEECEWLSVTPVEGTLEGDEEQVLNLTIRNLDFESGFYETQFTINNQSDLKPEMTILLQSVSAVNEVNSYTVGRFSLNNAYPNPFNSTTMISYEVPYPGLLSLKIFDINGHIVKEIHKNCKSAGVFNHVFNADYLPTGLYILRMEAPEFSATGKLILLR